MQSGIGPFVGVFLQERGWATGLIGTALTIGNVAGMLVTTPIGGFAMGLMVVLGFDLCNCIQGAHSARR